jgi:hypothetical protein
MSFPVRAEFIAGSLGGERGFSAIFLPCGFWLLRCARRSAAVSVQNPMIFVFVNTEVC